MSFALWKFLRWDPLPEQQVGTNVPVGAILTPYGFITQTIVPSGAAVFKPFQQGHQIWAGPRLPPPSGVSYSPIAPPTPVWGTSQAGHKQSWLPPQGPPLSGVSYSLAPQAAAVAPATYPVPVYPHRIEASPGGPQGFLTTAFPPPIQRAPPQSVLPSLIVGQPPPPVGGVLWPVPPRTIDVLPTPAPVYPLVVVQQAAGVPLGGSFWAAQPRLVDPVYQPKPQPLYDRQPELWVRPPEGGAINATPFPAPAKFTGAVFPHTTWVQPQVPPATGTSYVPYVPPTPVWGASQQGHKQLWQQPNNVPAGGVSYAPLPPPVGTLTPTTFAGAIFPERVHFWIPRIPDGGSIWASQPRVSDPPPSGQPWLQAQPPQRPGSTWIMPQALFPHWENYPPPAPPGPPPHPPGYNDEHGPGLGVIGGGGTPTHIDKAAYARRRRRWETSGYGTYRPNIPDDPVNRALGTDGLKPIRETLEPFRAKKRRLQRGAAKLGSQIVHPEEDLDRQLRELAAQHYLQKQAHEAQLQDDEAALEAYLQSGGW